MTKLLFAEHAYQVDDILKKEYCKEGQWIALGPAAMHSLSGKKIPYMIPEDFCSREEIWEICNSQFDRLSDVCSLFDKTMLKEDLFLAEWGIQPFLFSLWQLGQLMDGLAGRALYLKKILKSFPASDIYVHLAPPQAWACFNLGFSKNETLWGRLLSLPGWNAKVHTLFDRETEKRFLIKEIFSNQIKRYSRLYNVSRHIQSGTLKGISFSGNSDKNLFLVLNGAYEWRYLFPDLIASGGSFYYLSGPGLEMTYPKEGVDGGSNRRSGHMWEKFKSSIGIEEIDYLEIIRDRFEWITDHSPFVTRRIIHKLQRFFAAKKIKALLAAGGLDFGSYVARQYCKKKNIPVISWQLGAQWRDKKIIQRADLLYLVGTDATFVYGDEVKNDYETSRFAGSCRIEPVGSVSLESLRGVKPKAAERGNNILYVITQYYRNVWYCGFSPPYVERLYYREQMAIVTRLIEILKDIPDISVTIKLFPGAEVHDEHPPWVKDLKGVDRLNLIIDQASFSKLLSSHDIVIVDLPTTTLLQAVATKLSVFALMSIVRWPDRVEASLKKRAICADSANELMDHLREYLVSGVYKADAEDNTFLKLYGNYLDDGKCKERVLELLRQYVKY